jgi:hypothetical protein
MTTDTLTGTTARLPLEDLAAGFDANRAPHSLALSGREITTVDVGGSRCHYSFADTTVRRRAEDDQSATAGTVEEYIAFEVDADLYFVQVHPRSAPTDAISLVLDLANGRAVHVVSSLGGSRPGRPAVRHVFTSATLDGATVRGAEAGPTTELIGRRALWVYSSVHAYEHIYLSPRWYTWQCLAGPARGQADTDEQTTWQVRPGIYLFAWRGKVIPGGAVMIADHRDINHMRSHGALFGYDEAGTTPVHLTFGAYGRLLSTTVHPAQYDPAGTLPVAKDPGDVATAMTAVTGPAAAGAWGMR